MTPSSLTPRTPVSSIDKSFYNPFTVDISLDTANIPITGAYNMNTIQWCTRIIPNARWSHLADLALLANGEVCFLYPPRDVLKLRADINVTKVFRKPRSKFISVIRYRLTLCIYLYNTSILLLPHENAHILYTAKNTLKCSNTTCRYLEFFNFTFSDLFLKLSKF